MGGSFSQSDASPWDGVRQRVARLQASSAHKAVFGADGHRFELAVPLTPEEVAEVEGQVGVRLPAEYRSFLTEVGAGGAGPFYGIFPLTRHQGGRWRWVGDGAELTDLDQLATAFEPGDLRSEQERVWAEQPDPADQSAYLVWVSRWDDVLWPPGRTAGGICLCHEGCGHHRWLVVSGPDRGGIWSDGRAGDVDLAPVSGRDGHILGFAQWYLEWLAQAEAIVLQ